MTPKPATPKHEVKPTCENCQWWTKPPFTNPEYGACNLAEAEPMPFEVSGHSGVFSTRPDFGCNQFKAK